MEKGTRITASYFLTKDKSDNMRESFMRN